MVTTMRQETKERIVRATAELFHRKGYHAVGLNEILDEAESPEGSFDHFFDSKEDVAKETIHCFGCRKLDGA